MIKHTTETDAGEAADPAGGPAPKDIAGVAESIEISNPRAWLRPLIEERNLPLLLKISGALHGHYCPGLSLGVMAAVEGLHGFAGLLGVTVARLLEAEGLEELLAVVETNNCMTDGVQAVSGCTFGNNGLIFHDLGKTAVTIGNRTGRGLRLSAGDYRSIIDREVPEFTPSFEEVVSGHRRDPEKLRRFKEVSAQASFAVLTASSELFRFEEVEFDLPGYAEMQESRICSRCGETVMAGRAVESTGGGASTGRAVESTGGGASTGRAVESTCNQAGGNKEPSCIPCAGASFYRLTGNGIEEVSGKSTIQFREGAAQERPSKGKEKR